MSDFDPSKLHVSFEGASEYQDSLMPRCYTLTHSDRTGDLFLTIGRSYNEDQISDWYTKLMRDEVLGEWQTGDPPSLHIHLHVSGGFVLGPANWRDGIFKQHLPMVLSAICYGDRAFLRRNPALLTSPFRVHFHAKQDGLDRVEEWGNVKAFLP